MKCIGAAVLAVIALLAIVDTTSGQTPLTINWISVDTDTQMFVDDAGRTRLFHGVNAVYKIPPWLPSDGPFNASTSLGPDDAALLASWGFNVVRLGVMWPGVQPQAPPAGYNKTYLQAARSMVDMLGQHGIYTIVDFHQDIFSRKFCGEGVPDWAVAPDPNVAPFARPVAGVLPVDNATGYPPLDACLAHTFGVYYPSAQVSAAFQRLYDNADGLQDQLVAYWQTVASTFADAASVLGYELINEPWPGDIYTHPRNLLPGHSDRHYLSPMYQNINDNGIRPVDSKHIVFFEDALVDLAYRTGFEPSLTPGGVAYQDRQALSYHIYCGPSDAEGDPRNVVLCDGEDDYFYDQAMADVRKVGAGGMLTEFGAVTNASHGIAELQLLTNLADKHLQSWAYWQYKSYFDLTTQNSASGESLFAADGQPEYNKVNVLSRTYAQAIAGTPTKQSFDNGKYLLVYNLDRSIQAPTVIYANPVYYPAGFTVDASVGVVSYTNTPAGIWITVDAYSPSGGVQSSSVRVTPNKQ